MLLPHFWDLYTVWVRLAVFPFSGAQTVFGYIYFGRFRGFRVVSWWALMVSLECLSLMWSYNPEVC